MYVWWSGADPGDLDRYMTYDNRRANITVLCKDHRGETIRNVLGKSKEYIKGDPIEKARYRLAGGVVGTQAAVNEVIAENQRNNVLEMLLFVFTCTAITFASITFGLLVMVPLMVGTFSMFGFMYLTSIDLNINTLPVASLGIGIGVDYAIYMGARILDEYRQHGTLDVAFKNALPTTGKTVLFTAVTFTLGVITWALSSMRFQALMGILLGFLFMTCMVATLILVPSLVALIVPRWATEEKKKELESVTAIVGMGPSPSLGELVDKRAAG
jgi:predicted RND superfamily exporter protein